MNKKIDKIIVKFLSKPLIKLDGAREISLREAKEILRNPIDEFKLTDEGGDENG